MDIYELILENREAIKIAYGIIIALICMIITLKADRLFRLSLHQGIRYFRNAFFFFSLAFLVRYVAGTLLLLGYIHYAFYPLLKGVFEFFIIMAGFFLLYSLLWKKFESPINPSPSSLLNRAVLIFYLMTMTILSLDYLWETYHIMFASQIILFLFTSIISYINYKRNSEHKFAKYYFIAIFLSLITWILNAVVALYLDWSRAIVIDLYILNILAFFVILIGAVSVTRK